MRERLFLLFILLFTTTSFFSEDTEKQVRQLHQNGEIAYQQGEYASAKALLEELLGRIDPITTSLSKKYKVDWSTYIDVTVRLANCYEELNQKEQAEKILSGLIAKRPPALHIPRIELLKTCLMLTKDSLDTTYLNLLSIALKVPFENWSRKQLTFFHTLEDSLNEQYDKQIVKAKRYLAAGLYKDAIDLYHNILSALEKKCYPKVTQNETLLALFAKKINYKLAECSFLAANDECAKKKEKDGSIDYEMLYHSTLFYQKKHAYEKSISSLQDYVQTAETPFIAYYDTALFEKSYHFFQQQQFIKAKYYLEKVHQGDSETGHLAAIYLARINLKENNPEKVAGLLKSIIDTLPAKDPLKCESYYLCAQAAYDLKDYRASKELFERSYLSKDSSWWPLAAYHLGWCNLYLAQDSKDQQTSLMLASTSKRYFESLLGKAQDEVACLSLAQTHLFLFKHLKQKESLEKFELLLNTKQTTFSLEGHVEAFLLRAESQESYIKKEKLYQEATQEKYSTTKNYVRAWYCRGLNHFQQGVRNCLNLHADTFLGNAHERHSPLPAQDLSYFELAIKSFEKAFPWGQINAKAQMYCNSPTNSFALLEKLLIEFNENIEEQEETLYLRGLIAATMSDAGYFNLAEESLQRVIQEYPEGKYRMKAFYTLGTLYYVRKDFKNAEKTFVHLGSQYPFSKYAATSWFWAAEAADLALNSPSLWVHWSNVPVQGSRLSQSRFSSFCDTFGCSEKDSNIYRFYLVQNYPRNAWAAEAYLRIFPYTLYLEGNSEAISHLKKFQTSFPDSPQTSIVHYLIGLHEKSQEAKVAFKQAISAFIRFQKKNIPLEDIHLYYHYQSILELASLCMNKASSAELEEIEYLLMQIVDDFLHAHSFLITSLKQEQPYPRQLEEAEFKLLHCYLQEGKIFKTQKILTQMLGHYSEADIHQGYLLSQVWKEQGQLSLKCKDYETALLCFETALDCGNGYFSAEQKLVLQMLHSDAYRGKNSGLHSEIASPLRLKMF